MVIWGVARAFIENMSADRGRKTVILPTSKCLHDQQLSLSNHPRKLYKVIKLEFEKTTTSYGAKRTHVKIPRHVRSHSK